MANDELQTRISEQRKLVEDKKKLMQNLKNLEQVEKEVRVEIDKILPEKTKFEEWAKYFGNDGKSDQVLNWFGDELKKLKAKLTRVQGMRTKIKTVQAKIDSKLVRLNDEIEQLKNLPRPVVKHDPSRKSDKGVQRSDVKIPAPKNQIKKTAASPKTEIKRMKPETAVSNEKSLKERPEKQQAAKADPHTKVSASVAAKPAKPTQTPVGSVETRKNTQKTLVPPAKLAKRENNQKSGAESATPGKDKGFSPAHKNLLQDIAQKAKLTAEKIETEKKEKTGTEQKPSQKPVPKKEASEKKDTLKQSEKHAPVKIAAKPANEEKSEVKTDSPEKKTASKPGSPSPTKIQERIKSGNKTAAEKRETKPFSRKLKEQKYKYINGQPVRENGTTEKKSVSNSDKKMPDASVSKETAPGKQTEKRKSVFSNIKGKFFNKSEPTAKTGKSDDSSTEHKTVAEPATRKKSADTISSAKSGSVSERYKSTKTGSVEKADKRSSEKSAESSGKSQSEKTSEMNKMKKSGPEKPPEKQKDKTIIQAKSLLDKKPVENKKDATGQKSVFAPKKEHPPESKPVSPKKDAKKEVVVEARSILADSTPTQREEIKDEKKATRPEKKSDDQKPAVTLKVELKPEENATKPKVKPSETSVKTDFSEKKVPLKPAQAKSPQEVMVETRSLLHDETDKKATAQPHQQRDEKKSDEKARVEPFQPEKKPPVEKTASTPAENKESAKSKSGVEESAVDSDSRKSGNNVRVLRPFRSKEDVLFLGIDLGTYETTIAGSNGVIATAVSAVGWPKDLISRNLLKKDILFGEEALKNKLALKFFRPLAEGVIKNSDEDLEAATELIKHVLTLIRPDKYKKVYAVIGAPAQANLHNEQAIFDAAREVIDAVTIVSEPFAVAYGEANIYNTLVIDIGAGTTDLCRLRGTMPDEDDQITLLKAGDYIDEQLVSALQQRVKGVQVTKDMARRWKESYSFVMKPPKPVAVDVTVEGKPLKVDISSCIRKSCEMIVDDIADSARKLISSFDPEFQPELKQNIVLAGGGSLIHNLDVYLTQKLNMLGRVNIKKVPNPIEAGARGALALAMDVTDDFWRGLS